MSEKVKLKQLYVKLKQAGKEVEAQKVLKQVQNFGKVTSKPVVVKVSDKAVKHKAVKKKDSILRGDSKFTSIADLSKIKGIGYETISDISSIYASIDELICDLKDNKSLPLRNDIEEKLKGELI